ncbi:Retrotransposon gag protein [Gossypium australe]|uniref:Retrotransposon gag protein n=1 Tax=Gossypium australe TaxID=47621 RepID=A0A5B6WJ66_9ROSI|nr:Retrotransposon gag protein [Gossypium australe]
MSFIWELEGPKSRHNEASYVPDTSNYGSVQGNAYGRSLLSPQIFIEVSDSFKLVGVPEGALRLKLFPYSLREKARAWLNSLPPDFITTWKKLSERFLMKYFSPSKNVKWMMNPYIRQERDSKIYNGLNVHTRMVVDASTNGALLSKSYNEAYEIIERISRNNYRWPTNRATSGKESQECMKWTPSLHLQPRYIQYL